MHGKTLRIVATLVAPASIVLLDEPTAGLAPDRRGALAAAVRERSRSAPILMATQDKEWLSSLSAANFALGSDATLSGPSSSEKTD